MNIDTRTYVFRILRHLPAFHWKERDPLPEEVLKVFRDSEDEVLGVYENEPGTLRECVVVTTRALGLYDNGIKLLIPYSRIRDVDHFPEEKRKADQLKVKLIDGRVEYVPIRGRSRGGADVCEFMRFIVNIIRMIQRQRVE